MTTEKKVSPDALEKALSDLRNLAKGHDSKGTNTTKVESMSGVGGATQVHHTPSNSDPGGWAGSRGEAVAENGAVDSISSNGTDLAAGMRKSIKAKLEKGQPLTAEEYNFVMKGGFPFGKDDDKDDDKDKKDEAKKAVSPTDVAKAKDDEDKDEAKKSLMDVASGMEDVSKGLEVSEFLAGFANAVSKSLSLVEERITARMERALRSDSETSGEFQKSLASAIVNLGETLALQSQRIEQIETAPARGPKGTAVALEKSFAGGGASEVLSKSQVLEGLGELVKKGEVSALSVIKFESTGEIDEPTYAKVKTLSGRR